MDMGYAIVNDKTKKVLHNERSELLCIFRTPDAAENCLMQIKIVEKNADDFIIVSIPLNEWFPVDLE